MDIHVFALSDLGRSVLIDVIVDINLALVVNNRRLEESEVTLCSVFPLYGHIGYFVLLGVE